jgi:hypothetical protein
VSGVTNFRDDPDTLTYWHGTGGWISVVREALGDEKAFGLVLSRLAHDLRKEVGTAGAQVALTHMAEILEDDGPKC